MLPGIRAGLLAGKQKAVNSGTDTHEAVQKVVTLPDEGNAGNSVTDSADVGMVAEKLHEIAEAQKKIVTYSIDRNTQTTVIKVYRNQSGELIRQFPQEEGMALKANNNRLTGRSLYISA
jgi:uncharacterized FlaG/YvyC family protein